jgi:PPOX class probable F420-dependent enzyme
MTEISDFARLAGLENGLGVVTTVRPDRSIQASVVNAGVLRHPRTGADVVGFVAIGGARKLANLRADPHVTVVARSGWQWVSVEGLAEVTGPDDGQPPMDRDALRVLLRDVFKAAGGTHDDRDAYDRVMAEERRAAVLISPRRVYSSPQ